MPIEFLYSRSPEEKPSKELITYVIGLPDYGLFLRQGAEIYVMFDLACRKHLGKSIENCGRVLDFGCGIGRILQYFKNKDALSACDVLGPAIDYIHKAFPAVHAYRNELLPELRYAAESFDLVYSFSVFSHLDRETEDIWLAELKRVGKPGCLYLLTVHGDFWIECNLGDMRAEAERQGFTYLHVHKRTGGELDFPDYYQASFHTSKYIKEHWSRWFDVVEIIRGDYPENHLPPGMAFEPEGDVWRFGQMGQDLVILRKR